MNIRHSLLLTCALSTSILLSACGGDENLQLGTRDDIIIMKNGVPVDGSKLPNVETAIAPDMTVDTNPMIPLVEDAPSQDEIVEEVTQEIEADSELVPPEIEQVLEDKDIEPVTEVEMTQAVTMEGAEELTVEEAIEEIAEESTPLEMKGAKSVNANLINAQTTAVVSDNKTLATTLEPMATTPMKSEATQEAPSQETPMASDEAVSNEENVADEEQAPQAQSQEKVEEGCYRTMLIATTQAVPVMENRRIVCDEDLTPGLVAILQQALINQGAQIGAADGKMGNKTLNALEAYQRENNLAVGGLTYETLKHLNIKI